MKRFALCIFPAVAVLLVASTAMAAEPDVQSVTMQVPGGDKVTVPIPAGWKHNLDRPPSGIPPTLDLTGPSGILLKLTFMADPQARFTKPEDLEKLVTQANQQYVANSLEKRVTVVPITTKTGLGAYSVFTDARLAGVTTPAPGDFRMVTSGALTIGRQVAIFSVLSNTAESDEYRRALDVVKNDISIAIGGA